MIRPHNHQTARQNHAASAKEFWLRVALLSATIFNHTLYYKQSMINPLDSPLTLRYHNVETCLTLSGRDYSVIIQLFVCVPVVRLELTRPEGN